MRFLLVDEDGEVIKELSPDSSYYPENMVRGDFVELSEDGSLPGYFDVVKRGFVSHPGDKLAYEVMYHVRRIPPRRKHE